MAIGRFERKIVLAITAVAVMPLLGALILGQRALREAYAVGVNDQVEAELHRGLALYREHFAALREDATRTAEAVAHDHLLNQLFADRVEPATSDSVHHALDALLRRYRNLVRIELRANGEPLMAREREGFDGTNLRLLTLDQPLLGQGRHSVRVTVGTSAKAFQDYQRAGELAEVFGTLKRRSGYVSGTYLAVYITLLLSVIAVALGIGLMLARRVTRRVSQLAAATERVGAGDLSVAVPDDDLDEVGELTRAFNAMVRDMRDSRERIEYLSRIGAWQEFARRLAHEIKNPLTPILLAVQEVHRSYKGDDSRFRHTLEDAHAIIEEEVATLRRLVSEFSEFARLPEAHLAPADLGVFVREAIESPARTDEFFGEDLAAHAAVKVDVERRPLPVQIDSMLLKRCIDNLVRNALQALRDRGSRDGMVVVAARADGDRAVLEVRDNGPGISEQARCRVFDPYYTTKSDGTGLGLPIVKKIVLEHDGEIRCESAPEGGACMQIWLPLSRASRSPRTEP